MEVVAECLVGMGLAHHPCGMGVEAERLPERGPPLLREVRGRDDDGGNASADAHAAACRPLGPEPDVRWKTPLESDID